MGGIKKKRNNRKNKKNKIKKAKTLKTAYHASIEDEKNEDEQETEPQSKESPNKRLHDGDDSDENEERPKKKKKKSTQAIPQDSTDKKGKKSIRQMKRERYLQRQAEAESVAKDQFKSQCLAYLSQWKHDKANWKFMKVKQGWLYKNKFSSTLLPDESWPLLLDYFDSAQGNIRNLLLEDANKVIKQMDDCIESEQKNSEEKDGDGDGEDKASEVKKPDEISYKRARDIIQRLQ